MDQQHMSQVVIHYLIYSSMSSLIRHPKAGVRGIGKSDKEGFYAAALWLHKNHPETLAINLKAMDDFGYFKDLPELLFRLREGIDIRNKRKTEWQTEKYNYPVDPETRKRVRRNPNQKNVTAVYRRYPIQKKAVPDSDEVKPKKQKSRKEKAIEFSKRALERYGKDTEYKNLHDKVSDLFAEFLISDLKIEIKSYENLDTATLLCESIARRIFPRSSNPDYENTEEAHYAYRFRDRLRKEYLVPLRKVLELPEVYMSSQMWESLPYNRVSSVAMKKYKRFFEEHDQERFNEYLESVNKGEAKIAAGALLPHEIIGSLIDALSSDLPSIAELQWRRMVDDMSKIGKLNDCLAICDVSGSMNGTPMDVSVALGLLVSEITQEPWKGHVITFSEIPQLPKIEADDLRSKTTSIKRMAWGESTDFQKVFDLILKIAVDGKLKEDQMIKRLFVFSDMEFNESRLDSAANDWETDYEVIQNKFRENGYMNVPEMVFWNLRDSSSTPVLGQQKGVALVSGFSKNMIKPFLDGRALNEITPVGMMDKAISGEEYIKLVVVD
ncbi:hypothetical protein C5167_022278 [Papaver somniferum]|uniref:TROVE domain-containing protein n=1 Tax=Papaver somniferum TaxID=3469 RepID=A0A4Y7JHB9_PAPSO|nr:hypothetical protein C5167_022278 [Papaver somniferum]